ncbi:MAG: OmpH family outer membrane protein [Candidatus Methylomirabilaceae bacterium]
MVGSDLVWRSRWLGWTAMAVILLVPASWAAEPAGKVGFVDIEAVISQSKEGQAAKNRLSVEAAEKQKEITTKESEIKQMDAELQKQTAVLSDAAKKDREEAILRKVRDLRRLGDDFNRDLAKREQELLGDLYRDLAGLIRDYGKQKGFVLIVEKRGGGVIYGSDTADLTKEILERYNSRPGKK